MPYRCIILIYLCLSSQASLAYANIINPHIPEAKIVGEARMNFLVWKVYDAALYAPQGEWHGEQPFALSLNYLRDFQGKDIAARSIKEMRQQGFDDEVTLARWYEQLRDIIPDVKKNVNITGIKTDENHTLFYHNGNFVAKVADPLFTKWFFSIWLSEKTSAPKLRRQLLGQTGP